MPSMPTPPKAPMFGRLIAWDPVKQKEAWRQEHVSPWNGGTLTTAGNLVFQGTADGRSSPTTPPPARSSGRSPTGTGVVAAPSTYMVDGKQYVSVAVGWGGVYGVTARATERQRPGHRLHLRRGWQGATAGLHQVSDGKLLSGVKYDPADVRSGTLLYVSQLRDLSRRARRGQGRQYPQPRLYRRSSHDQQPQGKFVFSGPHMAQRHAGLHRQAAATTTSVKITAFIQGVADSIAPKEPAAAGSK